MWCRKCCCPMQSLSGVAQDRTGVMAPHPHVCCGWTSGEKIEKSWECQTRKLHAVARTKKTREWRMMVTAVALEHGHGHRARAQSTGTEHGRRARARARGTGHVAWGLEGRWYIFTDIFYSTQSAVSCHGLCYPPQPMIMQAGTSLIL